MTWSGSNYVLLANIVLICGTFFAPNTAYWCSPSSFELDCPCLSRISKVSSPDTNWRDLVLLQSMSWWWLLSAVGRVGGGVLPPRFGAKTEIVTWHHNVFVCISFNWWKVTSLVFFFFSFLDACFCNLFYPPKKKDARNFYNFLHINSSSVLAQCLQRFKLLSIP